MAEIDHSKFVSLLHELRPESQFQAVEPFNLGFSNRSFRLTASNPDQSQSVYVVKQYIDAHNHIFERDAVTRAKLEHMVLTYMRNSGIQCPEPIFFDVNGSISGLPILVTSLIPGEQILAHPANPLWAEKASTIASLLAEIHIVPCPDELADILPSATATIRMTGDTVPDYMRTYLDGESIWKIVCEELPRLVTLDPVLLHGDYWSGNMLWNDGQLTGILDWENVALGDAGFDLAYCRMEMLIDGMDEAAEIFLKTYEAVTGKSVTNLALCELAICIQPIRLGAPWLTISPMQERFQQFVSKAMGHF